MVAYGDSKKLVPKSGASEKNTVVGVFYFNQIFGHVHSSPLKGASSLTTIGCGHPVRVMTNNKSKISKEWFMVKIGPHDGFIMRKYLSTKRTKCFQEKYPRFFTGLNLDLSELYYWGKLNDQFVEGKSMVNKR